MENIIKVNVDEDEKTFLDNYRLKKRAKREQWAKKATDYFIKHYNYKYFIIDYPKTQIINSGNNKILAKKKEYYLFQFSDLTDCKNEIIKTLVKNGPSFGYFDFNVLSKIRFISEDASLMSDSVVDNDNEYDDLKNQKLYSIYGYLDSPSTMILPIDAFYNPHFIKDYGNQYKEKNVNEKNFLYNKNWHELDTEEFYKIGKALMNAKRYNEYADFCFKDLKF